MSEKRFTVESTMVRECILDNKTGEQLDTFDYTERLCGLLNDQCETIRKQSIRIYCQDKEIQRLLGELEKIPKSIREVWLEE